MTTRLFVRLASLLVAFSMLAGCAEMADMFEIMAFEESNDPKVQRTGRVLREMQEEREFESEIDRFLETGDPTHLDRARELRPDDTGVRGYDVALATIRGTPEEIEAAKRRLILAEARRLQSVQQSMWGIDPRLADPPITAAHVERNALGEILVAQTMLLGGSLNREWEAPGPDANEETQKLFRDYCATRNVIQTEFNDPLDYLPLPDCSGALVD